MRPGRPGAAHRREMLTSHSPGGRSPGDARTNRPGTPDPLVSRPLVVSLGSLAALALALAAVLSLSSAPRAPEGTNLLIITVDTLRADRLGAYGHAAAGTPVVDALAARGMLFTEATTPFPRTTPALASLFTGLWPYRHGSREVGQAMDEEVTTLAQVLSARGYTTVGVCANGAAGVKQGLSRGFGRFLEYEDLPTGLARSVTDSALAEVAQVPAGEPLFLWVHYIDPHFPYLPPAAWAEKSEGAACRKLVKDLDADRWSVGEMFVDVDGIASKALEACRHLYDREIAYTDAEVGRLLDGLREAGRLEPGLVVFTSDHGENMGEAGLYYEHGPSVNDASLRVPLVVAGAGVGAGVDGGTIRLEDLMPTLLGLLGVAGEELPAMDGADLSRRLAQGLSRRWGWGGREPVAFAESGSALLPETTTYVLSGRLHALHCLNAGAFSLCAKGRRGVPRLYDHEADPRLTTPVDDRFPEEKALLLAGWERWKPEGARERTVRTTRFKLVEEPRWRGGYRRRLYDLAADPAETRDVSREHPEAVRRLAALLEAWTRGIGDGQEPGERDAEDLETLRALGYVQ